MSKKYLAFDIGCIECGESSEVIGIFNTEEEAEKAIENYIDGGSSWGRKDWGGQHLFEIFEIEI